MKMIRHIFSQLRYPFLVCTLIFTLTIGLPSNGWGTTPKVHYLNADSCYQTLRKDPKLKKYRHHWLNCIDRFEQVYTQEPHNPWAAAGMYRAAQIQLELYKYSKLERDRSEASDRLNRITNRYPESLYTVRAKKLLASIETDTKKIPPSQPKAQKRAPRPKISAAPSKNVSSSPSTPPTVTKIKTKKSLKYLTKKAASQDRATPSAPPKPTVDSIEITETKPSVDPSIPIKFSQAYRNKLTRKEKKGSSRPQNGQVTNETPKENWKISSKAQRLTANSTAAQADNRSHGTDGTNSQQDGVMPHSDPLPDAKAMDDMVDPYPPTQNGNTPSSNAHGDAFITGLRYWSTPSYTRVVIDAAEERKFTSHLLDKNPELNKPQRLYVDIDQSVMGQSVPTHTIINDDLLTRARAGQHTPHSVRVVVDIKSFDNYKIFSLNDPFRMVIDVWGQNSKVGQSGKVGGTIDSGSKPTVIPPDQLSKIGSNTDEIHASAIAKQLALGVNTIVIDPGHGGKDPGALGYIKGVYEKDIVLSIAKKLAIKMRKKLKCNVILTRTKDIYLTLEERTAIANTKNADLFISLHCNAARNKKLTGIETFYLNLATDESAINVAARENATSRKNISDLQSILNDLMKNAKINESSRLSSMVQDHLVKGMSKKYSKIRNLGVKQAPFYVLLGATMPSILIETSFISNKTECKRLTSSAYQNALCDAIINGVKKYIKETDPRAI